MPNILTSAGVSNAQYSVILEETSDGVVIVDATGSIKKFNKKCERLLGYTADEVVGRCLDQIVSGIDLHAGQLHEFSSGVDQENSRSGFREFDAKSKSGVFIPIEMSFTEVSSDIGTNYIGVIKDVSERKIVKDRLASTETRLLAMSASYPLACVTFDLETMLLTEINEDAEVMFNGSRDQILGLHPSQLSPEFQEDGRLSTEGAKTEIEKTIEDGKNQFFWTHAKLTGELFPCEINTRVAEFDGRKYFVASIRDMTEQRLAEENLRAINEALKAKSIEASLAQAEAEKASAAKSHFMANMSHELRTPLNAVLGFSETMALEIFGSMPNAYREYASHVHSSASHLMEMIEELLDLSRIEAGKVELHEEEFSVSDAINDAVKIVSSAQARPMTDFSLPAYMAEARIFADQRIFRQILINLVGNAAKFSKRGQSIAVNCAIVDEACHVMIQDEGIGIEPGEIDRLFDPYERSQSTIARNSAGTGLGLPISRSLIQLHGGNLTLTSEPHVGTCVEISVPAERVRTYQEHDLWDQVQLRA